jgi:hypothetical protein
MDQGSMSTVFEHGLVVPEPAVKAVSMLFKVNPRAIVCHIIDGGRATKCCCPLLLLLPRSNVVWVCVVCVIFLLHCQSNACTRE